MWAVYGYKADNRLELTFKRQLSTGDTTDFILRRGATVSLVWAFGYPDRLYHGLKNRGSQVVMFDQTLEWSAATQLACLGSLIITTLFATLI